MANEYLKRTPTSTGNRRVWTWAAWVKVSKSDASGITWSASSNTTTGAIYLRLVNSGGYIMLEEYDGGYNASYFESSNVSGSNFILRRDKFKVNFGFK